MTKPSGSKIIRFIYGQAKDAVSDCLHIGEILDERERRVNAGTSAISASASGLKQPEDTCDRTPFPL